MREAGIYLIRNIANGKVYIGSAVYLEKRWWQHRTQLRSGKHHSVLLQRAWDKSGESAFEFKTLLRCASDVLLKYEQMVIDAFKPEYNISRRAGSCLGVKHTAEAKAKMAAAKIGVKRSLEARASVARGHIGIKFSAAHLRNMSLVRVGKKRPPFSADARKRMSVAQQLRRLRELS